MSLTIPKRSLIERKLPIEELYELSIKEGNSKKPVYQMHKWWARRLGTVFRFLLLGATLPSQTRISTLWKKFYSQNNLSNLSVLDPFMGGGTSIVEATKCNAKTIGIDIDPVASFITRMEIEDISTRRIEEAFEEINDQIGEFIREFYTTELDDGTIHDVIYSFWVHVVRCEKCDFKIKTHPNLVLGIDKIKNTKTVFCEHCSQLHELSINSEKFKCDSCKHHNDINSRRIYRGTVSCPNCGAKSKRLDLLNGHPPTAELFAIEYQLQNAGGRNYKLATNYDHDTFLRAELELKRRWNSLLFPKTLIPIEGRSDLRPIKYGFKYYWQLFNSRQLLCLSLIFEKILSIKCQESRDALLLAFSDTLSSNNVMCLYEAGARKLTPLFGLHAYNLISRPIENNVWGTKYGRGSFEKCVRKVIRGKKYCAKPFEYDYKTGKPKQVVTGEKISARVGRDYSTWENDEIDSLLLTQSTESLSNVGSNSIDLILTDPPYFDNLSYSELSDFYYSWLRIAFTGTKEWESEFTPYKDALFVNPNSVNAAVQYTKGLIRAMQECQRVLKPDGIMVLTFHHRKSAAWASLLRAIKEAKLIITNTFPVRSEGTSGFHSTSGSIKWDAVLTCRHGERQDQALHIGHLMRHVLMEINKWEEALKSNSISIGWADKISFGYAIAIKRISQVEIADEDTLNLLEQIESRLHTIVPPNDKHLSGRDIQPQLLQGIFQELSMQKN